jgi:hypothetical protein
MLTLLFNYYRYKSTEVHCILTFSLYSTCNLMNGSSKLECFRKQLSLRKIWGFHGSDYEECRLLLLCRMTLVRTDVSEECNASIIRIIRISEVVTLAVTSKLLHSVRRLLVTANVIPISPILVTLMMEALCTSKASVLTRATRCKIREDSILHLYLYCHPSH